MLLFSRFVQSTTAARVCCIVLLAVLAGLVTEAFLKLAYQPLAAALGASAPALSPPAAGLAPKGVPAWMAGGAVGADGALASSDIKLMGVVAQGASGYALIQFEPNKRAQVLRVGQKLADGTQLKSVSGQSAVLINNNQGNNQTQTLYLQPSTSTGAASTALLPAALNVAANAGGGFTNQMFTPPSATAAPSPQAMQQAQQAQQIEQLTQAAAAQSPATQAIGDPSATTKNRRLGARP